MMKHKLDTPKSWVDEALRLAVAFRTIQHEITEMVLATTDDFFSDMEIEKKLEDVEDTLQAIVGRVVMYEGLTFEEWNTAIRSRHPSGVVAQARGTRAVAAKAAAKRASSDQK